MLRVIGWKIWYGNGTTFSSRQGTWERAPDQDVQVVMVYYDKKDGQGRSCRTVFCGDDKYWKNREDEFGTSFEDIIKEGDIVKHGKWTNDEGFERTRLKAMKDYSI